MKNSIRMLMIVMVMLNLWGCADKDRDSQKELNIKRSGMVSVTATVEAVDLKSREVTLKAADGKSFTLHAGEEVVNLPQVKVGDQVVATYSQALAVRMAEPGETRNEKTHELGRAKPGDKPGAYAAMEKTVTAKIEAIDKTRNTASLMMPSGDTETVKVMDPTNLDKVKVGDTIVITYQEALAISIMEAKQ